MKLTVLILDDEPIILEGLCSFPWDMYGCHVTGSATEGSEGLELVDRFHPDIILSDIKMPGMDGLEFSKRVKKEWPDTEIILLTGYDNFSFAQQALHIGVCEYLLKPVNFREMHAVIEKVSDRIRKRREHKKDYTELRKKYQQSLPLLKNKMVQDLIHGRLKDRVDMKKRMELLDIKIMQYVLVYGRPENSESQDLEPGLFDFVICNICEEFLKQVSLQVYSETDTLGYCFVVTFPRITDGRDCENHCVQACEQIQESILSVIHTDISFGISEVQKDPYSMNMSYKQAVDACEQSIYMGDGASILEYRDVADIQLPAWNITSGEKKLLISEIVRGNIETVRNLINQIFEECLDLEAMRYAAMELLISCLQYIGHESVNFHSDMEKNTIFAECMSRIYAGHSRREIMEILKKALGYLSDQNRCVQLDRNQQTVQRILEYIEERYSEDLSLDSLSEHFKISKTYINRLLKNHAGSSFLEILLDCRMKKAKELLMENSYKIYEVAERVGYHDLSHFIRSFKKKYGVTPNAYRRI